MVHYVSFPLPDGDNIVVEVDEEPARGSIRVARADGVVEASKNFDMAVAKLKPVAEGILAQLKGLSAVPESVVVELGIKFSAEAGVVIAKTAVEGNCTITLTWKRTLREQPSET